MKEISLTKDRPTKDGRYFLAFFRLSRFSLKNNISETGWACQSFFQSVINFIYMKLHNILHGQDPEFMYLFIYLFIGILYL